MSQEINLIQSNTKPYTPWDEYVPIIKDGTTTNVYLLNPIDAPENYGKLVHLLLHAEKHHEVILHINNGGGWVDTGFMLVDAIKHTKAKVTARLTGTVGSISTVIALACKHITVTDYLSWLSHNYSGGIQGKGGELKSQMTFMSNEMETSFREIHRGFFTDKEMTDIIKDGDYWLNSHEVRSRLEARKSGNTELLETIAQERVDRLDRTSR